MLPIPLTFIASGYGLMASHNLLPRLYQEKPQISTPLFAHVFNAGGAFIIPIALTSVVTSTYLAYMVPQERQLWIAAVLLTFSALLWTRFMMIPGIMRVIAISESEKESLDAEDSGEHIDLMKAWTFQNYIRAALFGSAGLAGLWAVAGQR